MTAKLLKLRIVGIQEPKIAQAATRTCSIYIGYYCSVMVCKEVDMT